MLKAILIDDEVNGIKLLEHLLNKHCPEICVIATETLPQKAIDLVEKHKPDVVFLDVEMPNISGFELLEQLKPLSFHVIFTTAYDNYAIKGYKYSAIDYLLKPITVEELKIAVNKLEEKVKNKLTGGNIQQFLEKKQIQQNRLAISSQNEIIYLEIDKISHLESDSSYTTLVLSDGKKVTSSKPLKDYEIVLNSTIFYRIHKTYIINLNQVDKYVKSEGGYIVMKNNSHIPVSREKRQTLMEMLGASL